MAIENAAMNYNWRLQVDDIFEERVQMVTPPKVERKEHRAGKTGNKPDKKLPGKKTVGDLVLEMLVPSQTGDSELWLKFRQCETEVRAVYIGQGVLSEMGPNNTAPVSNYFLGDIWVKSIETSNYETTEDAGDFVKRTVTFSVEDYDRV